MLLILQFPDFERGYFMIVLDIINIVFAVLFVMCYAFQLAYLFSPFIKKMPSHKETKLHKLAILVSARNEENVIGTLFDSIKMQDYPEELVSVFLVADNCTDRTADVGREHGVTVYERHNLKEIGKGYALDFMLKKISEDFGEDAFDAFVVFDADNILTKNYLSEINKTFSDGYEVVTSYRNTKNFGDSWLSASAAVWFLRESKYLNGSRMRIGACPQVSGTGFLFSNNVKKRNGGWPFHTLTEDYEFTCASVIQGVRFGYCETAQFYDGSGWCQSWRQRMRWVKGGLQGWRKYGLALFKSLFSRKFVACYDLMMSFAPAFFISLAAVIANIVGAIVQAVIGTPIPDVIWAMAKLLIGAYLILLLQSAVTVATEWKYIHTSPFKKLLGIFAFPVYIMTFIPICGIVIFKKVEWKPISHTTVNDDDAKTLVETEKKEDSTEG